MSNNMQEPLLEVRGLTIKFRTAKGLMTAVHDTNFTVQPNEILGIVGESGSGKTLSLMSITRLMDDPNIIIDGIIRYKGRELSGLTSRSLREFRGKEIATIFQDPMTTLTPVYSVGWQICEHIRAHQRVSRRMAHKQAVKLLREVGIPSPETVAHQYPHQLSGGMRQRVVIAMAISNNPSLLIADEPTTALDVTIQAQILVLLQRLQKEHETSIIMVTHDMGVVSTLATRCLIMYAGRIVEEGSTQDIFETPMHPYTMGLISSIPPLTGPKPRRLISIPGNPPLITDTAIGCPFAPRCAFRFDRCTRESPFLEGEAGHQAACFLTKAEREVALATSKGLVKST